MPDPIRLLYIDDDEGLGRLVEKALGSKGFTVRHVLTAEHGLRAVDETTFDAIALDHDLGTHTGLDLLEELRRADAPIIYVTGSDDAQVAVAALKAGAVDYVYKDVGGDYRELLGAVINSALEQRRLKREREEAQRQIAEAKERAEVLLVEINHRVANSLALVASIARLQSRAMTDKAAQDALADMEVRVGAIASIHRVLYTSPGDNRVDLDTYLHTLVGELRAAMHASMRRHSIEVEAQTGASVSADKAVSFGVIVTELVTNAYKYAYPQETTGRIRVTLARKDPETLELGVEDYGIGISKGAVTGSGVGTRIITAMASNLDTEIEHDESHPGTRMRLAFKG